MIVKPYGEKLEESLTCACCVCGTDFHGQDDADFVCRECKNKLPGHCCEYDDVVMDWGIETDEDFAYFWEIECLCGNSIKSRCFSVGEFDKVAKEVFEKWTTQEREVK